MNYTQAQIDRANAVSLEDFLRTQGETLIKSGRECPILLYGKLLHLLVDQPLFFFRNVKLHLYGDTVIYRITTIERTPI